jgi:hypothetical protein
MNKIKKNQAHTIRLLIEQSSPSHIIYKIVFIVHSKKVNNVIA